MASWLLLLLLCSAVALDMRESSKRGDIMKAIINQVAESMQVTTDSWVRIFKKGMERFGLIPPSFANEHKRAMQIMKKAGWSNRSTDLERLKRKKIVDLVAADEAGWLVLPSSEARKHRLVRC